MEKSELQQYERRCIQEEPAECVAACPLHVDARSFVTHVADGAWDQAWRTLRKTMPFAGILGRICDHPCELRCTRRERGDAIQIGALERACVATPAPEQRLVLLPKRDRAVAVVGSGLASLTAAWDLARKGYPVTVFDPGERVGGRLLESAEAVLPREVIVAEVAVSTGSASSSSAGRCPHPTPCATVSARCSGGSTGDREWRAMRRPVRPQRPRRRPGGRWRRGPVCRMTPTVAFSPVAPATPPSDGRSKGGGRRPRSTVSSRAPR